MVFSVQKVLDQLHIPIDLPAQPLPGKHTLGGGIILESLLAAPGHNEKQATTISMIPEWESEDEMSRGGDGDTPANVVITAPIRPSTPIEQCIGKHKGILPMPCHVDVLM